VAFIFSYDIGVQPVWDNEFKFIIHEPYLAFVRLAVYHSDNELLGSFSILLDNLEQGILYFQLTI
jgi:hypothetical protein